MEYLTFAPVEFAEIAPDARRHLAGLLSATDSFHEDMVLGPPSPDRIAISVNGSSTG